MRNAASNLETISWEATWQALRALLPNATHCTPASLRLAAENAGMQIAMTDAKELPQAESDSSLLRKLLGDAKPDELVIVVTDCTFRQGWTPFVFRLSEVKAFAEGYRRLTDECVISGLDVVLICPESKFLILYYHEGWIAVVR